MAVVTSTIAPPESALDPAPPAASRLAAAVAGATAAAVALAVGEVVVATLDPGPSLVTAVGSEFIDRFAAPLKNLAVALFGTNDKVALVVGIVVTSIVLGAVLGGIARRRRGVVATGFVAFGAIGAWALATDPQGSSSTAVIGGAAAALAGIATHAVLTRLAPPHPSPAPAAPAAPRSVIARRAFLVGTGSFVVSAAALAVFSRQLAQRGDAETVRRTTTIPRPVRSTLPPATQPFEVAGLSAYVTPTADFYRIDTALSSPRVDVGSWRLGVTGMVARPFELSYEELLAMDAVEETVTIACVSNEVGGRLVGNAVWQGVPLAALLERGGVDPAATQIVGHSVDGWTAGFPTADGLDGRTALVAYAMNGEPLPIDHGYPARLIVAGLYGYVSATKWLREIELTTLEDVDGYWIPRGWSKEGPILTQCRIDVPGSGTPTVPAGPTAIAGVAWAPSRGVERVEVRIDDGDWQPAELGRVASTDTWVQWHLAWEATPGDHVVTARATDATGETQTAETSPPAPDGARGYPSRRVRVA